MSYNGKNNKGGRPPGSRDPETILKEKTQAEYRVKASKMANSLLMCQAQEAIGTYKIIRKDEIYNSKGKMVSINWVVLEDADEINKVMNDFQEIDGKGEIDGKYYMIVKDKPNHKASVAILDRAWGKPKDVESPEDKEPIEVNVTVKSAISKIYGGDNK